MLTSSDVVRKEEKEKIMVAQKNVLKTVKFDKKLEVVWSRRVPKNLS